MCNILNVKYYSVKITMSLWLFDVFLNTEVQFIEKFRYTENEHQSYKTITFIYFIRNKEFLMSKTRTFPSPVSYPILPMNIIYLKI